MQQAAQRPAQPQGNTLDDKLNAIFQAIETDHQGYTPGQLLKQAFSLVVNAGREEHRARDEITRATGQKLDTWHNDYVKRGGTVNTLAGAHADRVWTKEIDSLAEAHDLPRSTIEALASGYRHNDGDTPDQLREGIGSLIGKQVSAMNDHRETGRQAKREQSAQLAAVGMPGVAAAAVPALPTKLMTDAGDIADHFAGDGPAS